MAICQACKNEMLTVESCSAHRTIVFLDGTRLNAIRATAEDGERCGDCGVRAGGYHHPGCDLEVCPRCDGQLISCDCFGDDLFGEERVLLIAGSKRKRKSKQRLRGRRWRKGMGQKGVRLRSAPAHR